MSVKRMIENDSAQYEHARAVLGDEFDWLPVEQLSIPCGLIAVVRKFLSEIEVLYSHSPELEFMWIIAELNRAADEPYQRSVNIFIQVKKQAGNKAKDQALKYSIDECKRLSGYVCCDCGQELIGKHINEDELERFPFLNLLKSNGNGYHSTQVCMSCAETAWNKYQADVQEKAAEDLFDPEDPFAMLDNSDEVETDSALINAELNGNFADITNQELEEGQRLEPELNIETIQLYTQADIDKMSESYKGVSRDNVRRMQGVITKINAAPLEKKLIKVNANWREYCDDLEQDYPNFAEVIQLIKYQCALSVLGQSILKLPPILLVGPPGVGKTAFMQRVSQYFKTSLEVINICSSQSNSMLAGSEEYWGNSDPGRLFKRLVYGDIANPVLMLDELDKARSDGVYNPLSALHQLLEPEQAALFHDLSVPELQVDASYVVLARNK